MALKIGLIVVLVIVVFLAYAATRPSEFRLKRTAHISASPETIFPHINDFHRWAAWSPFEKLDPAMKKTFSGAPRNRTTFTIDPTAGGADVSWEMTGANAFIGKVFHVFINMDKMLGRDFESGLASLKSIAESQT